MPNYAITGAFRGLGLELVKQLSATPTNNVFALVRKPATTAALKDLAVTRPGIYVLTADVTDPKSHCLCPLWLRKKQPAFI
jgi:NAD(P)-dependent dehydrogenase (short-subunit alcohol dehydrogenase family)